MYKVVAFRDIGWVDDKTDYRQWDHACRAYGADLQMVKEPSEINIEPGCKVVIFEEAGLTDLEYFEHPESCVYIFGRSGLNNMQKYIEHDETVRINTVNDICLFGITAVGIALHDRHMKNGNSSI